MPFLKFYDHVGPATISDFLSREELLPIGIFFDSNMVIADTTDNARTATDAAHLAQFFNQERCDSGILQAACPDHHIPRSRIGVAGEWL